MNRTQLTNGTWISTGSPIITELASFCGFDWVLLDMEHGCLTEATLLQNLQAVIGSKTKAIVRIGQMDASLIARVLDWGAAGIMLPHVSTPEQASECVKAMNYPPLGHRGFSSSSRSFGYGTNAPESLENYQQPLFIAQIENYEGVTKANLIAAVKGVDMLFVGPSDLKLDLKTRPKIDTIDYTDAISIVATATINQSIQAGILVRNMEDITHLRNLGFSCLAFGSDLGILRQGYEELLTSLQSVI